MQRKLIGLLGAAAIVTCGAAAFAGARYSYPVYVDLNNRYAYGQLASTRATSDNLAQIGSTMNGDGRVCLFARDSTGSNSVDCCIYSPTPAQQAALGSVSGDSYVYFTWDSNYTCQYVVVENSSVYLPKLN